MWRVFEQEGVHVDSQFDGDASAESDGNKMANAGEYASYKIFVRNTGVPYRRKSLSRPTRL